MFHRLALLCLAGVLVACDAVPRANVSRDWTDTIADLGLTAIYPVREDANVGDLLVAATPKPTGDANSRTFGRLNTGAAGSISSGQIVALPTATVSSDDAIDLGLGGGVLARALGLSDARNDRVSITLTGVESVEIDDSTAWGLLSGACQPGGYLALRQSSFDGSARSFGAYRNARRPGYLTVVTTVYYASGVNYQLGDSGSFGASASVNNAAPGSGTSGSSARAASDAAGTSRVSPSGDFTGGIQRGTTETLNQSFAKPLAFAYDGFTVQVNTPGTLCQAVLSGDAAVSN